MNNNIKKGIALTGVFGSIAALSIATPAPEIIVSSISTALESLGAIIFATAGAISFGYVGAIVADYHRMETKGILTAAFGGALLGGTIMGYLGDDIQTSLELATHNDQAEEVFKAPKVHTAKLYAV